MYAVIDIETEGLTARDEITMIGLATDSDVEIHYQTGNRMPRDTVQLEDPTAAYTEPMVQDIEDIYPNKHINFVDHPSEEALLTNLSTLTTWSNTDPSPVILTGFNSENFDIPHLRTRSAINDIPFPLSGYASFDLARAFKYKFRTDTIDCSGLNKQPLKEFAESIDAPIESGMLKRDLIDAVERTPYDREDLTEFADKNGYDLPTSTRKTLEEIYGLFDNPSSMPADPFDDSKEAATAFEEGRLDSIARHNAIDLKMTHDLLKIADKQVHDQEQKIRSL